MLTAAAHSSSTQKKALNNTFIHLSRDEKWCAYSKQTSCQKKRNKKEEKVDAWAFGANLVLAYSTKQQQTARAVSHHFTK